MHELHVNKEWTKSEIITIQLNFIKQQFSKQYERVLKSSWPKVFLNFILFLLDQAKNISAPLYNL